MNFCILGAGAWGTAMAIHLNRGGHSVTLVPRRFEQALDLTSTRRNRDHLPEVALPHTIQIAHELRPALMEAEVIVMASPMKGIRDWASRIGQNIDQARSIEVVVSLTKGLELETFLRPTDILREAFPQFGHAALSGPTNALEVAEGKPTAMVLAGEHPSLDAVQEALSDERLRVYRSTDLVGVELGAALKNVYAIAAGCCDGLGLGDNARAALLTRSLAEMLRIGNALGARSETFYGLSGFGDLVATSHGLWSRNREFGHRIGQGESVDSLLAHRKSVVEGYRTALAFHQLCHSRGLSAPILAEVHNLLYEGKAPAQALRDLMTRELKPEQRPALG